MTAPDDAAWTREVSPGVTLRDRERELLDVIARLEAQVAELQAENARPRVELAKANRNSSNSSKPPSSDIVKPPKPAPPPGEPRRKIGGQFGHEKHERAPFPRKRVDRVLTYDRRRRQGKCGDKPPR